MREVRRAGDIQIRSCRAASRSIDKAAPDVAIVALKLPANERLQFLAGQYIDFLLKDGKRRSFSLATPPHDDALLELHIRHVPGGFFTDQLFTQYKGREILRFEGPLGAFYLREESDKPIIFVAGGTGFAPIKAMHRARASPRRRPADGALLGRALAARSLPAGPARASGRRSTRNFTFIPVLSEPQPRRRVARPHGLRAPGACSTTSADLSGYQVYACGGPAMIDAARRDFTRAARCRPRSSSPTASPTRRRPTRRRRRTTVT